jgi:hypothetical protein
MACYEPEARSFESLRTCKMRHLDRGKDLGKKSGIQIAS